MWRWWSFPPKLNIAAQDRLPDRLFCILIDSELSDEAVEWVPDDRC